jgi:hypothetical protein
MGPELFSWMTRSRGGARRGILLLYVRTRNEHDDEVSRVTHYPAVSFCIYCGAKSQDPQNQMLENTALRE